MAGVKEYKCPSCGASLTFDSTLQKMKCAYCGTEVTVEAMEEYNQHLQHGESEEMSVNMEGGETQWTSDEQKNIRIFVCNSCGGELMTDATTAATSCPYCGNAVVLTERLSDSLRPDYVIPFKLSKENAKNAYRDHLKGKFLLPKAFSDENHIDEIKGVYVPYWVFDAKAEATGRYNATKTAVWDDSEYYYTRTSYYSVLRQGTMQFEKVPVDGSKKMPDDLMESLEPYSFTEARSFKTAYLAGYLADRYDVSAKESLVRANERIRDSAEDAIRATVRGYKTVTEAEGSVKFSDCSCHYALFPVWLLNTTWRGKRFTFAMNGQTGKMVGDLPPDTGKAVGLQLVLTAVFGLIAGLIMYFVF